MRHITYDSYECVMSRTNESRITHMTEHVHRNGSDGYRSVEVCIRYDVDVLHNPHGTGPHKPHGTAHNPHGRGHVQMSRHLDL